MRPVLALLCPLLLCLPLIACSGDDEDTPAGASGAAGSGGSGQSGAGGSAGSSQAGSAGSSQAGSAGSGQAGSGQATTCAGLWAQLATLYPDAGAVGPCPDDPVAASLMNLAGRTIDNNGAAMTPCVEARCDENYAYVATNTLPHYDFVQTTPNALVEAPQVLRVPRKVTAVDPAAPSEEASAINGCVSAHNQFLTAPDTATTREPSQLCYYADGDTTHFTDTLADGSRVTYRKINCLGTVAFLINGVVVAGPNEGPMPDPYGNPIFFYPDKAGQTYGGANTAALDLCGGHTANSMHYHGVNEACFTRADDGSPALSYATAASTWDFTAALDGACTAESGVVGWSPDGHPIKGPCVCTQRNADGTCAKVKRARSSWAYQGLGSWQQSPGAQPDSAGAFATEGTACTDDTECCTGTGKCHFKCTHAIFDDQASPGGSTEGKRCVMLDYSWCSHRFVDRSTTDTSAAEFVYLDRCNGLADADGYAYHTTASFPFIVGCYHDEPASGNAGQMGGNPMGGNPMGMGGGMQPPTCAPGQTMCCGDGFCGGPENAQNCPADCGA